MKLPLVFSFRTGTTALVVLALVAPLTAAQDSVLRIRPGESVTVTLPAGDPRSTLAVLELTAEADGPLTAEARSLDLEPFIKIFRIDDHGEKEFLAGARGDPVWDATHLTFQTRRDVRYRIELRPLFEEWGGEVEVTLAAEGAQPLHPVLIREAREAYWAAAADRAEAAGSPLLRARAVLGTLLPHPARPRVTLVEYLPPVLIAGAAASEDRWSPHRRQARLRADRLAELLERDPEWERAKRVLESHLGPTSPAVGDALLRRGAALSRAGALTEAGAILDRAGEILEASLGSNHPQVMQVLACRGRLRRKTGDYDQAATLFRRALDIAGEQFGPESLAASYILEDLGLVLWLAEKPDESVSTLKQALQLRQRQLGPTHLWIITQFKQLIVFNLPVALVSGIRLRFPKAEFPEIVEAIGASFSEPDLFNLLWNEKYFTVVFRGSTGDLEVRNKVRTRFRPQINVVLEYACVADPDAARACAEDLVVMGWLGEASRLYTKRLELEQQSNGPDDPRVADALRDLAVFSWARDATARATLAYAQRAGWVRKKGKLRSSFLNAELNVVRRFLTDWELTNDDSELAGQFERAVSIRERTLGPDHLELALALEDLGSFLWRSGRVAEADPVLQRAHDILTGQVSSTSLLLGLRLAERVVFRTEIGSHDEVSAMATQSQEILSRQLSPDSSLLIRQFYGMAWALRETGAIEGMERVLEVISQSGSLGQCAGSLYLRYNVLLADLRARQGNIEESKALLLEEVGRCAAGDPTFASVVEVLADGYEPSTREGRIIGLDELLRGRKRKAINVLKRVGFGLYVTLAILGGSSGPHPGGSGARPRATMAPARDPREAFFYETAAGILREAGLYREAAAFLRGSIEAMQTGVGDDHPRIAVVRRELAEAVWDIGGQPSSEKKDFIDEEKEALDEASFASRVLNTYLGNALAFLPEQQALRLVSTRAKPEAILFSGLLFGDHLKWQWYLACWEWTLHRRALVLDELAFRRQRRLAGDSPEVQQAWEAWVDARRRLAALWVQGPHVADEDSYWAMLDSAAAAREEAETALSLLSGAYRESESSRYVSIRSVWNALPPDSVLVEYVRIPVRQRRERRTVPHYVALILATGPLEPLYADLGPAAPIDDLVQQWHERLHDSLATAQSGSPLELSEIAAKGGELREAVWDPVAEVIGDVRLAFVVLDGALHQVNFSALPTPDGRYLIETGPQVHVLSTGRDLDRLSRMPAEVNRGVLAIGAPDYDAGRVERLAFVDDGDSASLYRGPLTSCTALREKRWDDLPESGLEAQEIGDLFRGDETVEVLTGAAASEEQFKRSAPGKRILHVATHAFFLNTQCLSAASASRSSGSDTSGGWARQVGENPLLLSGLVLAGANGPRPDTAYDGEDGILTSEELAVLNLQGLEIATLSACDTGLGTVESGEGVFGLRRALEIAGTRTVLMSLWPVPDRVAREWMGHFYRTWRSGGSILDAKREASLAALEDLRSEHVPEHPYLWACFVAAGDWR